MGLTGARGMAAHFRLPGLVSLDFVCRLAEPSVHSLLPSLVEVGLQDHAILTGHHDCLPCRGMAEQKGAHIFEFDLYIKTSQTG